jgi:hypothetical protein
LLNTAPQPLLLLLLLDICTWQGGTATEVLLPVAGRASVLPPAPPLELELELELLELELLLELTSTTHGGTITFDRLLFFGSSSWLGSWLCWV